jgi:hypothetical protein
VQRVLGEAEVREIGDRLAKVARSTFEYLGTVSTSSNGPPVHVFSATPPLSGGVERVFVYERQQRTVATRYVIVLGVNGLTAEDVSRSASRAK